MTNSPESPAPKPAEMFVLMDDLNASAAQIADKGGRVIKAEIAGNGFVRVLVRWPHCPVATALRSLRRNEKPDSLEVSAENLSDERAELARQGAEILDWQKRGDKWELKLHWPR